MSTTIHAEDKMTELEIRVAEHEYVIDELSSVVAEQWKTIEQLQSTLDRLTKRLLTLEQDNTPETPITRPPHW